MQFEHTITDPAELRRRLGEPSEIVLAKCLSRLDEHCRAFIAKSPFLLIASANARGEMDVSPKGDPAGFVRVLDDTTLAIPDRLGNRLGDTFYNVLENPQVGLIFLVPGKGETLRVNGTAQIVVDPELLESMAVRGKAPAFALAVEVREAFLHCAKCMIRSNLWKPGEWPDISGLATLAQAIADQTHRPDSVEELEEGIRRSEAERLY